ncbi:MAG TPA: metallophosphoesterase [Polyangia bacterium]|jgi:predicted phosphodiesterase
MRSKAVLCVFVLVGCSQVQDRGSGDSGAGNNGTGGNGSGANVDMAIPISGGGGGAGGSGGSGGSGGGDSCVHSVCTSGVALNSTCSSCATQVCASDSYCCSQSWNSRCVSEATTICGSSACSGGGGTGGGGGSGGGGTGGVGGGGGNSGGTGGTGGLLKFAVFGDCRPPNNDDTSGYPSTIVSGIFKLAQSNGAQFVIGTGDYMFATSASAVTGQVALFKQAMADYTAGPIYLAMGNHECTGATASNCPNLNETPNVQAYMQMVPSGITTPYYRIDMNTPLGTAKFIFVAANAWSSTQESWLTTQLAQATTYTFIMRHEPTESSGVPTGVTASEPIVTAHPYTLEIMGHTHEYSHVDTQHVISGNAGAPLESSGDSYGLLIVEQQSNGNITVSEIDEATGNVSDTWSVSPTGQKM